MGSNNDLCLRIQLTAGLRSYYTYKVYVRTVNNRPIYYYFNDKGYIHILTIKRNPFSSYSDNDCHIVDYLLTTDKYDKNKEVLKEKGAYFSNANIPVSESYRFKEVLDYFVSQDCSFRECMSTAYKMLGYWG